MILAFLVDHDPGCRDGMMLYSPCSPWAIVSGVRPVVRYWRDAVRGRCREAE